VHDELLRLSAPACRAKFDFAKFLFGYLLLDVLSHDHRGNWSFSLPAFLERN
jgi:hypothetical protein